MRSFGETIIDINDAYNYTIRYKTDAKDHWQTPKETARLRTGDCEDIAIAKYFECIDQGISIDDLMLVVGRERGIMHMVLKAKQVILNNTRLDTTLCYDSEIKPLYGFNEKSLWLITKNWTARQVVAPNRKWEELLKRKEAENE